MRSKLTTVKKSILQAILLSVVASCGCAQNGGEDLEVKTKYKGVINIVSRADLPSCDNYNTGAVYYIDSTDEFVYCVDSEYAPLILGGGDGLTWVVTTVDATYEQCNTGGKTILAGPDRNGNSVLEPSEVIVTEPICNGKDGSSCTVTNVDPEAGTYTLTCEDGSEITIANGADGSSCSITEVNQADGTYTLACEDGTSVTVNTGVSGDDSEKESCDGNWDIAEDCNTCLPLWTGEDCNQMEEVELPVAFTERGRDVTISQVQFNGNDTTVIEVQPDEVVSLRLVGNMVNTGSICDGCVTQLYAGISNLFSVCLISLGLGTEEFDVETSFAAPSVPGTYYINPNSSWEFHCLEDVGFSPTSSNATMAVLVVSSGVSGDDSEKESCDGNWDIAEDCNTCLPLWTGEDCNQMEEVELPVAFTERGRDVTISQVQFNGNDTTVIEVQPDEVVSLRLVGNMVNTGSICDGCVTQLYAGISNLFSVCLISLGLGTEEFDVETSFAAPSVPGTYYINPNSSWEFHCLEDVGFSPTSSNATMAVLVVSSGVSGDDSEKESCDGNWDIAEDCNTCLPLWTGEDCNQMEEVELPVAFTERGRDVTISQVQFNGNDTTVIEVQPDEVVSLRLVGNMVNTGSICDGCVTQLYAGISNLFSVCLISLGLGTEEFDVETSFAAPSVPGTYYINPNSSWEFHCLEDVGFSPTSSNATMAVLVVN